MAEENLNETRSKYYVQPWRRYFAKTIDYAFLVYLISILSGIFYFSYFPSHLPTSFLGNLVFGVVILIVAVFAEAVCLALFSTTLGKFLMATKIVNADGAKLSLRTSLLRSYSSLVAGSAVGIPVVSLMMMALNYMQLETDGVTIWDKTFQCYVVHNDMNLWRWVVGVSLVIIVIASNAILTFASIASQ